MTEWLMIACMGIGGVGFAVGGTGLKWVRRFLVPALLGFIGAISGFSWQMAVGYALLQSLVLHLPYGERTPYWLKFVVFMTYGLPGLMFGYTNWVIIAGATSFLLFLASNWRWTAQTFAWKICEFIMGTVIGAEIASLIAKHG